MRMKTVFHKKMRLIPVILLLLALCVGCSGEQSAPNSDVQASEPITEAGGEDTQQETETSMEDEDTQEGDTVEVFEPVTLYASAKVNVRTEPSTESDIVMTLNRRDAVEKVGECGEWSQVQIDGAIYYVASQYLVTEDELPSGYVIAIDVGHQQQRAGAGCQRCQCGCVYPHSRQRLGKLVRQRCDDNLSDTGKSVQRLPCGRQ